ncbi:unnamed protein product [Pelagomonas calceolata]|uniref:Uncharacterized protein n=1 Tax=Pelagomonas calceolata TaxID=35677 RepID=A0A8J2T0T0_9STRA|nr:unnamed protein product [Pelagomonas calceolata]|mmetsp:Transcript_19038/g.54429  ORF Transcript_19038/g.54429 Transcript_19038/m.54429 type:complete len:216 (+) Transcript_19038:162-809(+)
MVLKQERRVNAASVAKRQSISAAAAQKKLEIEEAAREAQLQKAWAVGADERSRRRQDEENQRETRRAEKQQAKDEALRNDEIEGPSLVKPRRAHSSDDLLGLALMQQTAEKRLKARRKKPNSPPRTPSMSSLQEDMLDVQRNTNRDVDTDALRREAADERMLSSVRRTQSCGTLGGLVVPPSPPRSNGKKFSRKGVRKVPSKSSLRFVSEELCCA